jgi:hypothetical protein
MVDTKNFKRIFSKPCFFKMAALVFQEPLNQWASNLVCTLSGQEVYFLVFWPSKRERENEKFNS